MKKLLVICLAFALFASMGCGNRPDSAEESNSSEVGTAKIIFLTDPVDGSKIGDTEVKYSYVYQEVEYRFNSKKNYEAFKKEPEKYLKK